MCLCYMRLCVFVCVCVLFFGSLPLDTRGASGSSKPLTEAVMASVLCVSAYCLLFVCVLEREREDFEPLCLNMQGSGSSLACQGCCTNYCIFLYNLKYCVSSSLLLYMCPVCGAEASVSVSVCADVWTCMSVLRCLSVCKYVCKVHDSRQEAPSHTRAYLNITYAHTVDADSYYYIYGAGVGNYRWHLHLRRNMR
jgi:hypothetical protein